MPPFPKPRFAYGYDPAKEIAALRHYVETEPGRAIPSKAASRMLLVIWNIANLGVQERRNQDYRLIAEIISWFDVAAIQECHDNLAGIRAIKASLPASYRLLFSDASGNDERLTFLYDADKVTLLEEIGEVAPPPSYYPHIKLTGVRRRFDGLDRNPYLATFRAGGFPFSLVNVHLYYGSEKAADIDRRSLETYAVALWADRRRCSKYAVTHDILPLGDFNLPKDEPSDPIYKALTRRGLHIRSTRRRSVRASLTTRTTTRLHSSSVTRRTTTAASPASSISTARSSVTSGTSDPPRPSEPTCATTSPIIGRHGLNSRSDRAIRRKRMIPAP
jgi:hypothetical protein